MANAAEEGAVDCSGAFYYWYGKAGSYMYHGSNTMWRNYTTEKGAIGDISLVPGMAVFKRREWKTSDSDNRYYGDDIGNFYHVGLYIGGGMVAEAQDTAHGCVYTKIEIWTHCARLKNTVYDTDAASEDAANENSNTNQEEELHNKKGIVATQEGRLNVRKTPSMKAVILDRIDKGTVVDLLEKRGDWYLIRYGSKRGWCSANYIEEYRNTYAFSCYGLTEEQIDEFMELAAKHGVEGYAVEEGED